MEDELNVVPEVWARIYGRGPGYVALFSGVRAEPSAKLADTREAYFALGRETAAALAWIEAEAGQGRELYQCAHLVGRWRRRKEDALPLAALYVDLDAGLPADALEPSVLVESSPGHYQAYYALTRRVLPGEGAALNKRLAHALDADVSGWDLTQLLRIPGTTNHKYPDRPRVRLAGLADVTHRPEALDARLPQVPLTSERRSGSTATAPPSSLGSDPPIPLSRSALRVWSGEDVRCTPRGEVDRSVALVRIARLLHQAGLAREHVVAVLAERDQSLGWEKYTGRSDAREQYERIVDVVNRGAATRRQRP